MIIVRLVTAEDIDGVLELAKEAAPGMTTLPPDRDALLNKINTSTKSAASDITKPSDETYMLVMEDTSTGKLVGTAGIISCLGIHDQFYSYKLNKVTHSSKELDTQVTIQTLNLSNHFEGFAEVATLFLNKDYRKNGNGKLLARSRYMFMGQFRNRFPDQVMADMRGYFDENGRSPFWEAIGQKFFNMSYDEADFHGALNGNQFIADLMPKTPIYVNLLPQDAQDVIGRPNDEGRAAYAMLEKEGFHWNGHTDIFDGAPSIDAFIDNISTLRNSRIATVSETPLVEQGSPYIISTGEITSFKTCVSEAEILEDGAIILPVETMESLQLSANDSVRFCAV